jgi:cell division GTPase FtsZ
MKNVKNVLIVGAGGAGVLAALQFPSADDFTITRLIIDTPEALYKIKGKEDVVLYPLGTRKRARGVSAPKTRERAERDFAAIREDMVKAIAANDAVVMFAGLGGVVGSVCALGLAHAANDLQRPVVANVFLPFLTESTTNHATAAEALQALAPLCVFTCTISHAALNSVLPGGTEIARMLNAIQALHVWHSMDVLRMVKWL